MELPLFFSSQATDSEAPADLSQGKRNLMLCKGSKLRHLQQRAHPLAYVLLSLDILSFFVILLTPAMIPVP